MSRNEKKTCEDLIEPKLESAGWAWEPQLSIGPGRVNMSSNEEMYDNQQTIIADYLLKKSGIPLAVLEAKAEGASAADGMQQAERYARRLSIRFSIASNGHDWVLTDTSNGEYEILNAPPTPDDIIDKHGVTIDWDKWGKAFETPFHIQTGTTAVKRVRPYQEMAISHILWRFSQGENRALVLMATGTGKTYTVFQLIWKLIHGEALNSNRILFLTDRNSLKDQAFNAFGEFRDERVTVDKQTVRDGRHRAGKIFFANYQSLDEELDGKKVFEHYEENFFDLVVIDECHRSGWGDWFGVLEHFSSAHQLGLTATPRELEEGKKPLTEIEKRRDTYEYFGAPVFTYSLRQAIEDGYLVPYLLEQRVTNVDEEGFLGPDGKFYGTSNFEREIRMPDRTSAIAADLWKTLVDSDSQDEKTIVFCVDDTHAALMAAELRRLSGDPDYAARITRRERNSHQLERNFAQIDPSNTSKPRVAVTVDLLTTGFDAPDVKNIVFVRPLRSSILYKQMKGRGTRLCEDVDKRFFMIYDYSGASRLEDTEFDGHPLNRQKGTLSKKKPKTDPGGAKKKPTLKPVGQGVSVMISSAERFVCLADGRKILFEEYIGMTQEFILSASGKNYQSLLDLWIAKDSRNELREEMRENDIYSTAFRVFLGLEENDEVDVLSKVGFELPTVPTRLDRVNRIWEQDESKLESLLGAKPHDGPDSFKWNFWGVALDHYSCYGIDELEEAKTYAAPQFNQFGNFSEIAKIYGGAANLKNDLEVIKSRLYVPMNSAA